MLTSPSAGARHQRVTVLENLQGEIRIWGRNRFLACREITGQTLRHRRKQKAVRATGTTKVTVPWKPPADHPWRRRNKALFLELAGADQK